MAYKAYAATMQSVWFSEDEGISWNRLLTPTGGFYNEARTWALATHPDRPGDLLAGSDQGLYRYSEATGRFDQLLRSNRSRVMTLVQALTKSSMNFSSASVAAYTSAMERSSACEPNTRSTGVPVHFRSPVVRS